MNNMGSVGWGNSLFKASVNPKSALPAPVNNPVADSSGVVDKDKRDGFFSNAADNPAIVTANANAGLVPNKVGDDNPWGGVVGIVGEETKEGGILPLSNTKEPGASFIPVTPKEQRGVLAELTMASNNVNRHDAQLLLPFLI